MDVSYKDSWDKIEKGLQAGYAGSLAHSKSMAALEVKVATENLKSAKRLLIATIALAFLTAGLFISTVVYTFVSLRSYEGSQAQVVATNQQTEATRDLTKAVIELSRYAKEPTEK